MLIEELERKFGEGVWISGELGDQANVRCPYCVKRGHATQDVSGHLGLNFKLNVAHCVRCNWGFGNLTTWLSGVGGVSVKFTIGDLGRELKTMLDKPKKAVYDNRIGAPLPKEATLIGKRTEPQFFESLKRKGVEWQEVRSNFLMYCGYGEYSDYVIFPFIEGEEVVYWQGRAASEELLSDPKKKKRNPPSKEGLGKAAWLYGYQDIEPESDVYLVEGTLDRISLQRFLKDEFGDGHFAVSLQGVALSFPSEACHPNNSQWGKLKKLNPRSVNIVFDPDAHQKAVELSKVLQSTGIPSKAIKTVGKDPNESIQNDYDMFAKSFRASLLGEISSLEFELGMLS